MPWAPSGEPDVDNHVVEVPNDVDNSIAFDPISRSSSGLEPGSNAGKYDPAVEKSLGGHLLSSSYSLLSGGDAYTEFVGVFPGGVGNKAEETRAAFEARVREGYSPAAISEGARRYRQMDCVP